jgi:hypothetical protein
MYSRLSAHNRYGSIRDATLAKQLKMSRMKKQAQKKLKT